MFQPEKRAKNELLVLSGLTNMYNGMILIAFYKMIVQSSCFGRRR